MNKVACPLFLKGAFVEVRDVGFGLSNNALHEMYRYMSGMGISLNLSGYPAVSSDFSYVHTSSMNRVYTRQTFTDWLANREEWSPIDSVRDSYSNNPLNAETKLLLLSAEDKTILHLNNTPYTIIGTQEQFTEYENAIALNAPDFMTYRLEFINQYLSKEPATSGTLYHDSKMEIEYYGTSISGIDSVYFGTADNDTYTYDDKNQIIYGKEGNDVISAGGGSDILDGGVGNDVLIGNDGYGNPDIEADKLIGGIGYDTYIAGTGDTIEDTQGEGEVYFNNTLLTGGILTGSFDTFKTYEGDGGIYTLTSDGTLTFSQNGEYMTINRFHKETNDLGIVLIDDPENDSISIVVSNADVVEADNGEMVFTITLSKELTEDITILYETFDKSAVTTGTTQSGTNDYSPTKGSVLIAKGQRVAEISVNVRNDTVIEENETFSFAVTGFVYPPAKETIRIANAGEGTIIDNDRLELRILTTGAIESDGNISGNVTLTHPYDSDLTIILHTEDGSATSAEDYYADSAITVRIAKGERQGNFTVKLKNDEKSEPTEAFTVKIDSVSTSGEPVAYTLLQDIQPFVIKDDDNTIKIRFSDAPQTEEKGEKLIFGVTLESTIPLDEALSIQTNLGAVTFEAGETFKTIDHTWQDDLKDEPDEIIELYPTGSYSPEHLKVSFENTATGTILDTDKTEIQFQSHQKAAA